MNESAARISLVGNGLFDVGQQLSIRSRVHQPIRIGEFVMEPEDVADQGVDQREHADIARVLMAIT